MSQTESQTIDPEPSGSTPTEETPDPTQVRRDVLRLSGPALTEMFFLTLMSVINMVMVGHLGPESISAVGLSNQPFFLLNALFVALNVGTTALVARYIGAERPLQARYVARQSILMTIPLGLLLSALAVWLAPDVIFFMGGRGETLRLGTQYFTITGSSLLLINLSVAVSSILRGAGDTKTPMKIGMIANFLVVFFGWFLIYGRLGIPRLGVVGAGYALFLARAVMTGLALFAISRHKAAVRVKLKGNIIPDWQAVKDICAIGVPSALEQLILQGGLMMFVRIVAGLGTEVYAAHQIVLNILGLSFLPGQAFSIASTTLVGQGLGASKPELAEVSLKETRKMGVTLTAFVSVLFFVAGGYLMRLYTSNPEVIRLGGSVLRIVALIIPAQTSQLITVGGLRGAGDTRFPLFSTAFSVWFVRLSLARLLIEGFGLGLHGAWWAIAGDQYVRSVMIWYRFRTGRWKTILATKTPCHCKNTAVAH